MKQIFLAAVALFAVQGFAAARADVVLTATNVATIYTTGPRTGTNGKVYLDVEGTNNARFESFGVADFKPTALPGAAVTGLSLSLVQNNAAFSASGPLSFYLAGGALAQSIDPGSALAFDPAQAPGGIPTALAPLYALGNGTFTVTATGTTDVFAFAPGSAALAYVDAQVSAGGTLRLLIGAGSASVSATYSGVGNTATAAPRLTLIGASAGTGGTGGGATGVPAPGAAVVAGLAALAATRRRAA